jgi:molybdate transport system ATP-binding protein
MERWNEIPQTITHVIEFSNKEVSFCGERKDYEIILQKRKAESENQIEKQKQDFEKELNQTLQETFVLQNEKSDSEDEEILVEMKNVNVGWDGRLVLENLNWTLKKHEHWLIRGPNGCGKTTFLELITGDNKQVYSNDIWIFGIKRGSGESIWDIKKRLGIVSYRLHVEYRMIGGISLQNVIISGFRDSIGLYGEATDVEKDAAKKWLKLGGFFNRENELFSNLSYGEQRAILILRAAVKCPEILILDEPCHGLDEENRRMILHLLDLIAENKTSTLLHVTHDMNEVLKCEKHILEMEKK